MVFPILGGGSLAAADSSYTAISDPSKYVQNEQYTGTGSSLANVFDGLSNMQPDINSDIITILITFIPLICIIMHIYYKDQNWEFEY